MKVSIAKRYLVTTALESTYPEENEKILFLGEWCKPYSKKNLWENLDSKVLDYHWDNRNKFEKDYHYLNTFYEKILKNISIKMNSLHQVNLSNRYWRILLGPWLALFIQSVFDRWEMIRLAINSNEKLQSNIISESELLWTSYDYSDFKKLAMESDGWNNFIYSKIIELHHEKIYINKIDSNNLSSRIINSNNKNRTIQTVLSISVMGYLFDTILVFFEIYYFQVSSYIGVLPIWMIVLWPSFAILFDEILMFLSKYKFIAVILSSTLGPLTYYAGSPLGLIEINNFFLFIVLMIIFWAILMICYLSYIVRFSFN